MEFQTEIKATELTHYYYPENQLHMTIMGLLPLSIDEKFLVESVENALRGVDIKFQMR